MGNPWTDLVKKTFHLGKKTDAAYSLKDAMIAAKKVYKKGAETLSNTIKKKTTRRKSSRGKKRRRTVSR
jgi:hypothetical protein